ncbi:hypothetical protein Tco_1037563 [Tanacetum coccineum]
MSSASFAVTYTFVYTDSEPERVFWGANEEISDGGSPRVIVLGYDGLPMQPVASPSPDYIPGPEEPQTPPVPQDEDEHKPMFIQPHDPDYMLETIYLEYIPLEDEHEFLAEEQPLPPEDEDDETEDGLVDYPMDGGEDGVDDDGDSSRDDADDKDKDREDEDKGDEEEHLALADSAVVVPTIVLYHHPLLTLLPLELGLLSSFMLLYPFHQRQRYMAPSAHSSPPPVPSPLLPSSGCPTQIQTLRIASTQALVDAVTAALPSPPLPPSLYIPPPVDHRDDILEFEQPPHKRSRLFALGSRYEVEESSTARHSGGQGIDYGFVSTLDAEERRRGIKEVRYGIWDTWVDPIEAVFEIAPMTVGEVNTRVTELAELHKHDTQDLYALLEDAQDSRTRISQRVTMDSYMRREMDDMQAELLALQEQRRRARQPAPDARVPYHQDASRDADSHI